MSLITKVDRVDVHIVKLPFGEPMIAIAAVGEVPTSGWTHPRLAPRFYVTPPADGLWDFDFVADPPTGIVLEVIMPIAALYFGAAPDWCKGVRIHAAGNTIEQSAGVTDKFAIYKGPAERKFVAGRAILRQTLAVFDDSFQPTGTIHWRNDGPFGLPNPHVEMKKLRHELVLTVEGPDAAQIRNCVEKAVAAGIVAAIVAAVATGGAALQAAISTALSMLTSCLGGAYSVRIDDSSHWIYWDT